LFASKRSYVASLVQPTLNRMYRTLRRNVKALRSSSSPYKKIWIKIIYLIINESDLVRGALVRRPRRGLSSWREEVSIRIRQNAVCRHVKNYFFSKIIKFLYYIACLYAALYRVKEGRLFLRMGLIGSPAFPKGNALRRDEQAL
jgi:hypothetical protein